MSRTNGGDRTGQPRPTHREWRDLVTVALLYYTTPHRSQKQIADQLGVSAATVSRLLEKAKRYLSFDCTLPTEQDLEAKLIHAFQLLDAVVVDSGTDALAPHVIAQAAARYFLDEIRNGDSVAISCGGTLLQMVSALPKLPDLRLRIAPLSIEADPYTVHESPATLVGILRSKVNADSWAFGAHLFPPCPQDPDSGYRRSIRTSKDFQSAVDAATTSRLIFVGVGTAKPATKSPGKSFARLADMATNGAYAKLYTELGIVGEINNEPFTAAGRIVADALFQPGGYVINLVSLDTLRRATHDRKRRRVIAVAGGIDKADAIRAALRAGFVNVLITDRLVATDLIAGEVNRRGGSRDQRPKSPRQSKA